MSWIDWCIVIVPIVLLIWVSVYSRKYARGVVDFLAAGRIAGRYVMSVGDLTAGLSVITLVAGAEQYYQTGFSVGFWWAITTPVGIFLALSGYCLYRAKPGVFPWDSFSNCVTAVNFSGSSARFCARLRK